jgi:putative sigma-54 modulation protein
MPTVQINISTRHGNLNPATQEKITAKVERLSRFLDRITGIQVTVDLEHPDQPHVEVQVTAEHSADFNASAQSESVLAAVDVVVDKLEQQLRKRKEKRIDQHRGGGGRRAELS